MTSTKYLQCQKLSDLEHLAPQLIQEGKDYSIWVIDGVMGAGKTTLIKALCKAKGVSDNVSSPTFALVNEYRDGADAPVYHFDFYRMKTAEEAIQIGLEDYLESGDWCLLEWAERLEQFIPERYFWVKIEVEEGEQRRYQLEKVG